MRAWAEIREAIRRQGSVLVALIALLPAIGFSIMAVMHAHDAHRNSEIARLRDTARALASAMDAQLGGYVASLTTLANSGLPAGPIVDRAELEARLQATALPLGVVIALTGPGPDHPILAITGAPLKAGPITARQPDAAAVLDPVIDRVFRERRPLVSDVFMSRLTEDARFAVFVPVIRDGDVPYVLSFAVRPEAIEAILQRQALTGSVRSIVVDNSGRIIATTNFPDQRFAGSPALGWAREHFTGVATGVAIGPSLDGSRRVLALERIPTTDGWSVVVTRPEAEIDAAAWTDLRWVPIGGIALVSSLALLAWAGRRQTMRDAAQAEAAQRTGRQEIERLHTGLPAVIFLREVAPDGTPRLRYRTGDIEGVTGWTAEALQGNTNLAALSDLTPEDDRAFGRAVIRDGQAQIEYRFRRPDGDMVPIRSTARCIERFPDGSALIVGYMINVSAEMAARAAAEQARTELERTLANAPVAVFRRMIGTDGRLLHYYLSPSFLAVTGWAPESFRSGDFITELAPDAQPGRAARIEMLRSKGEWQQDIRLPRPDGTRFWARIHTRVLERLPDGTLDVIGYLLDVTQEHEATRRAIASARLASLGEMAAGLAHELRQPLSTMMMAAENAQFALEDGNTGDATDKLSRIVTQVERTTALIEHLRQFARGVPSGAEPTPLRLDAAVAGAIELAGRNLSRDGIALDIDLGDPAPLVLAQRIGLEQVLVNLLTNARDALMTLPAGRARHIRIAAVADHGEGQARLTVADTGNGIPPDVLARLFEPFVTSKGPDRGTGIGLSICFGLMEGMGGTIEGSNARDGGAVFTLTMRLATGARPASSQQAAITGTTAS